MSTEIEKRPFAANLGELESIVESLERGDVSLENLMEMYERGMKLHAECQRILRDAELRIEKLRESEGKVHFEKMDIPAGDAEGA